MQQGPDQRVVFGVAALLLASGSMAAAETVPLPRAQPESAPGGLVSTAKTATPNSCQSRLADFAVFQPLPPITGPGECMATDVVALNAVLLPDKRRVVFSPPATLRCAMAETVAEWITEDVAPIIGAIGTSLNSIEILESFGCRPRNGVAGAQVSEHGHANALDVGSFKLANGEVVELTSSRVAVSLREKLRDSACARFSTVLGNGADAYHDTHVHIDLMARNNHFKICQWDVLNAPQTASLGTEKADTPAAHELSSIPLPRPRPLFSKSNKIRAITPSQNISDRAR
jgi:hypothetical protein